MGNRGEIKREEKHCRKRGREEWVDRRVLEGKVNQTTVKLMSSEKDC